MTPAAAVTSHAFREVRRGAIVLGALMALVTYSNVRGYAAAYPDVADRVRLAQTLGHDVGLSAIFGRPVDLSTVAGYTGWRVQAFFTVVGPIWALLASTRVLRGDEEAGRWQLLRSGAVTARRTTAAACAGLLLSLVLVWVLAAVGSVLAGRGEDGFGVSSSLFFALALVSTAAVFLAVGAVTSQLAATRRSAAGLAGVVLGVAYLLRLLAGSTHGLSWLRWLSPLGWADALRPLAGTDAKPLLLVALVVAALLTSAILVSGARDEGRAVLPSRDRAPARTRLLGGVLGLAVRLGWRSATGWLVGMVLGAFVVGLVARGVADELTGSGGIAGVLSRLGVGVGMRAYLGVILLVLAAGLMTSAATRVGATRDEEASGHLDNLLVRTLPRLRWLSARGAFDVVVLALVGVATGVAMWAGVTVRGGGVDLGELVDAGLTIVPPALVVLGVGLLAYGLVPRAASAVAYAVVAWAFLVQIVVSILDVPSWLLDTSVLHHMALVPGQQPRWGASLWMVAVAAACAAVGGAAFRRRDLAGG